MPADCIDCKQMKNFCKTNATTYLLLSHVNCSGGPASSLMFCTNGVLLRMLTQGDGLQGVTHIIVDEVHERDRFAEFMLILLRKMLPKHPGIRVILMSATLHVQLFSSYFGSCPVIQACIPCQPAFSSLLSHITRKILHETEVSQQNGFLAVNVGKLFME